MQLSVWMVATGTSQRQTRESEGAVVGESVFRNLQTGAGGNLSPQVLGFGTNQDPNLGNFGGLSRDQLLSQLLRTQQQGLTTHSTISSTYLLNKLITLDLYTLLGNQFGLQQQPLSQFELQNNPRIRFPPPQSQEQFFQQPIFPTQFSQQNQFRANRNQNSLLSSTNDASRENLMR